MFATDEIGRLRMLSMRRLTAVSCLHDLEELSVLEEACIIDLLLEGHDGRLGPSEEGGGSSASGRACSEQELLELASRRCEVHRSEAQGLKWRESLEAISKDVARDLQTWFTHQRLNLSDSVAGSSRRLGVSQQRFSETVASIHELDQVLAKLRVVRLQVMGVDQGLAVVAADSLPLFWNALPPLARSALLRASTVCGICSLLYVLNLHKLTAYVIPTSTSETGRNGYQGTESRALFQGEWQLHRLENFGEEYYPANNPKLHHLRLHMSGFQIFGDIMEDLWGGEPSELSFVHLRKLERRLLLIERIARLFSAAEGEDAAPDRALLPPCSAVEFDEGASCGACSWAASELLSERDEVCSSTTSAVCAAERLGRAEETPSSSRASSPSIEEQDLETQINNGDDWLAARDDHLHDQRRKLKKEMVEPLVAFPDGEATNFLRGLETTKGIYVMHLEKRSSSLDGANYLSAYIE
eukprot:g3629.t1